MKTAESADRHDGEVSGSKPLLPQSPQQQPWAYIASISLAFFLFIADTALPRGATAAIGYCLVSVVAAGTRQRGFLLGITIVCTLLTWGGFFLEPPGSLPWMSGFDRAMITGVLWLTFVLISRRAQAVTALAHQTRALEETKRELERSNAELDSFASVVAHDIRGPLNTIGLFTRLLGDRGPTKSNAESAEHIAKIQSELHSLGSLIQSLLSYARVGCGHVHRTPCDCEAALESVLQKLKSELERDRAEITNDPLPTVPADRTLIEQLFQNLIENSIKYRSEAPPRVHVSASQTSADWEFFVRDNGIGIEPKDVERLFLPFQQLHGNEPHRAGVGLGLATCKRIVERHGGRIQLMPTHGQGTTLMFAIPVSPRASTDKDKGRTLIVSKEF
jgi:signal transduction histidine kinase